MNKKRVFDCIGMSCYIAWSIIIWNGFLLYGPDFQVFSFDGLFIFQGAMTAVGALLMVLSAPRIRSLRSQKVLLLVFALLSSASILVTAIGGYEEASYPMMMLGFGLSGLGSTLRLGWEERLSVRNVKTTALCLAISYAFAFVIFSIIAILPGVMRVVAPALLPFLCSFMLIFAERKGRKSGEETSASEEGVNREFSPKAGAKKLSYFESLKALVASVPIRFVVVIALAYFGYGATRAIGVTEGLTAAVDTSVMAVGSGAFAPIISIVLAYILYRKNAYLAFYIAFPLMAIATLLPPSFGPLVGPTIFYIEYAGAELVKYILWFMLIGTITKDGTSALFCLALLRMFQWAGSCLGQIAGDVLPTPESITISILVCLIAALLIMIGMPFGQHPARVQIMESDQDVLQLRAQTVARQYKLSPRETEVFSIWITGRSTPYIEKKLFISKNTVKTHLNHIYTKTKTANREELLELVDAADIPFS